MQKYRPAEDLKTTTKTQAVTQTTYRYVICKFHNILFLIVVHHNILLTFTIHQNSFADYWLQLPHSPDSLTINDRQKWSNGRTIIPQGMFNTCHKEYAFLYNQFRLHTVRKQKYLIYNNVPRVTQKHTYFILIRIQYHTGTVTNKTAFSPTTILQLAEHLIQNNNEFTV